MMSLLDIFLTESMWYAIYLHGSELWKAICSIYSKFWAYLCSPPAIERLSSGLFQEVIITNTIPVAEQNYFPQLTILSVANLLGETIWRVHDDCAVSSSLCQKTFFFSSLQYSDDCAVTGVSSCKEYLTLLCKISGWFWAILEFGDWLTIPTARETWLVDLSLQFYDT